MKNADVLEIMNKLFRPFLLILVIVNSVLLRAAKNANNATLILVAAE